MIFFRVDVNETIAYGHMMRCLSIARAARTLGEESVFFTADENAIPFLKAYDFSPTVLHTPWDKPEEELPVLLPLLRERGVQRLLIDSHMVTSAYLGQINGVTQAWYLDDLNSFWYPVSGLICYASYCDRFDYPSRYPGTELLLGTKYAPLRPEFSDVRERPPMARIGRLLLMSGGADENNVLGQILASLPLARYDRIDVICGNYNQHYQELLVRYQETRHVVIHRAVESPLPYMRDADAVVSAAGSTLYELCAVGTLTVSYVLADDQVVNAQQFQEEGLIRCAGDARKDDIGAGVCRALAEYEELSAAERSERMKRMRNRVDGKGALRIAKHMCI